MAPRKWSRNKPIGSVAAAKLLIAVIAATCFSALGEAIAADLEIPKEARNKWSDYMEFAKHIQGSSSEVLTDRLANNKVRGRTRVELKVRGFALAYSYQYLQGFQSGPALSEKALASPPGALR